MKILKKELETHLKENLTDIAIHWSNTAVYTNGDDVLTDDEVSNLSLFVEPHIIPISAKRELVGASNGFRKKIFFHINIYIKKGVGIGAGLEILDTLETLYRERYLETTICTEVVMGKTYNDDNWHIVPVDILAFRWN